MTAPQRIWAHYRKDPVQLYAYPWQGREEDTEYVRADLHEEAERRAKAAETRAARIEEALRRICDEGGEVEGFQLEFGIRGIAKMRDSARYVTESDMLRLVQIARAALTDTPREGETREGEV